MSGRTCGTISSYVRGKCRCDDCRAVSTGRNRARRAARRDPSIPLHMCPICGQWFEKVGIHEARVHR